MTPLGIIRQAQADTLIDEDGHFVTLELLPGLTQAKLQDFADQLPCRIPLEITELLSVCSGFYGTIERVDFTGRDLMFEFEPAFPYGLPIAADGYGNFWIVDLKPGSTRWGPIYFVCHDAPVVLFQGASLNQFLCELFRMFEPPHQSLINDVHEDRLANVWQTNPGVLSYEQSLLSDDPPPFGLCARARRQLSDNRPAPGETGRWIFLGPLRPEDADQTLPHACRIRLSEAEERDLPTPRTWASVMLATILFG